MQVVIVIFADILGSDAKYKLFCLNLMHTVKTQRSGELFVKNILIFLNFYMIIIKNYKVKKIFNKFLEISEKIGIISELTTLVDIVVASCAGAFPAPSGLE